MALLLMAVYQIAVGVSYIVHLVHSSPRKLKPEWGSRVHKIDEELRIDATVGEHGLE